jgi:hypothetical protein
MRRAATIGTDHVAGVARDELRVERAVLLRLEGGGS